MKEIPIITLWIEGAVFHGTECHGKAAILVYNSDVEGLEDEDVTSVLFSSDQQNTCEYQIVILMDDFHATIGGDETLTVDEIRARARAQVDEWQKKT